MPSNVVSTCSAARSRRFFATWLLYAGGLKLLLLSAILYGPGTILFIITRRGQGKQIFTPLEWVLFAVAMVGAVVVIRGLVTGDIAI